MGWKTPHEHFVLKTQVIETKSCKQASMRACNVKQSNHTKRYHENKRVYELEPKSW